MLEAAIIATGSVLVGAVLGTLTRRKHAWFGALQTFAVGAVAAAVAVQMLPGAVAELGGWGLLAFLAALATPGLLAPLLRMGQRARKSSTHSIGTELGFLGLLAHQLGEGLALGSLTGHEGHGHGHESLYVAVAAHTIPITALLVSEAIVHGGRASAWRRAIALAVATAAGFALAGVVHRGIPHQAHAWLSAFVAGLLVHVIFHDHEADAPRRSFSVGLLDVIAFGLGLGLPVAAAFTSTGEIHALQVSLGHAFVGLVNETAPVLLLGLFLGALLLLCGARIPMKTLRTGASFSQAVRGVVVGAPLPLSACTVGPAAESLRARGGGPALVFAFVLATPELAPETIALTVGLMGGSFAIYRIAFALLVSVVAGVLFAKVSKRPATAEPDAAPDVHKRPRAWFFRGYRHFDELLLHTAPWAVVGLLAAAYVHAVLPPESLAGLAAEGLDIWVVAVVAIPIYVCAGSATPLAAVLLLKGISPGAVLVGLLLGPATNIATLGVLRRAYGRKAAFAGLFVVVTISIALAYGLNGLVADDIIPISLHTQSGPTPLAWASIGVLTVVLVIQLWRGGTRPWFEVLGAGSGHAHRHEDHDHDHRHHQHSH